MYESMYGRMRVGIVHFKAFPGLETGVGPLVETLEKICADEFFTAIEVGWMKDYRVRNTARQLLDMSHLSVAYATQPCVLTNKLNLNSFDPQQRQMAINGVKNCVDEAYDLGAEVIRLIAGKDPGEAKRDEAKKLLVDSISQIMEYAKEEGDMKFTLKIFDRDIDKKCLIGHFVDALDVAKVLRPQYPNFGLLADLSHFPLLNEKPEEAIPLVKDYLVDFHVGNCVFPRPQAPRLRGHPAALRRAGRRHRSARRRRFLRCAARQRVFQQALPPDRQRRGSSGAVRRNFGYHPGQLQARHS